MIWLVVSANETSRGERKGEKQLSSPLDVSGSAGIVWHALYNSGTVVEARYKPCLSKVNRPFDVTDLSSVIAVITVRKTKRRMELKVSIAV